MLIISKKVSKLSAEDAKQLSLKM